MGHCLGDYSCYIPEGTVYGQKSYEMAIVNSGTRRLLFVMLLITGCRVLGIQEVLFVSSTRRGLEASKESRESDMVDPGSRACGRLARRESAKD